MAYVHYFTYIFFHTYPKVMKLLSLENKLNNLSGKKESPKIEVRWQSYGQNKL